MTSPLTKLHTDFGTLTNGDVNELVLQSKADGSTYYSNSAITGITFTNWVGGYTAGSLNRAAGIYGYNADTAERYGRFMGLSFYTSSLDANASEKMRIDSSGNLLVGTTSTLGGATDDFMTVANADGGRCGIRIGNSSGSSNTTCMRFHNSNGVVGGIRTSGSATFYDTSSDARLKDVTGSARGLEVINELNPVAYNWKADGKADEGLIAQEVLDVVPNAVSGSEEDMYQMDYSKLVVHLVAGMKEQQEQIESLKSEIAKLNGE